MPRTVGGAAAAPRPGTRPAARADVGQVRVDVPDRCLASRSGAGKALVGAGRAGAGEPDRAGGGTAVGVQAHRPYPPCDVLLLRTGLHCHVRTPSVTCAVAPGGPHHRGYRPISPPRTGSFAHDRDLGNQRVEGHRRQGGIGASIAYLWNCYQDLIEDE